VTDASRPTRPEPTPPVAAPNQPPLRLLARREAASNSKWQVLFDRIGAEGTEPIDDYLVLKARHCAIGASAGVCVVPIVRDDGGQQHVLMLHTYRHPVDSYFWEGARGFIDAGETPAAAACRELIEETGYGCAAERLVPLGTFLQEPSTLTCRVALFAAFDCQRVGTQVMDEPGLGAVRSFTLEEAISMAADGRIEEAATSLTLLRLAAMVGWARPSSRGP